jgi:hypothetical protein
VCVWSDCKSKAKDWGKEGSPKCYMDGLTDRASSDILPNKLKAPPTLLFCCS